MKRYSLIIPVYNRPDETASLLESLSRLENRNFETIVVEDGSDRESGQAVRLYEGEMDIKYFRIPNGGPGPARNYGASHACAQWLIFLDSDTIVPKDYLDKVEKALAHQDCGAFGGPDRAEESFTALQKAINFSMTSFMTTGGIRGGKKKLDRFYPRSFNMGVRKDLFDSLGGFSAMRYGEDIDLSIRIFESGAKCCLFPEAWLWHRRRTSLKSFFNQVHHSGQARIELERRHPGSLKPVHLLPAIFTLSCLTVAVPVLYSIAVLAVSTIQNRSFRVGALSVPAALIQLTGYGTGFLKAALTNTSGKK